MSCSNYTQPDSSLVAGVAGAFGGDGWHSVLGYVHPFTEIPKEHRMIAKPSCGQSFEAGDRVPATAPSVPGLSLIFHAETLSPSLLFIAPAPNSSAARAPLSLLLRLRLNPRCHDATTTTMVHRSEPLPNILSCAWQCCYRLGGTSRGSVEMPSMPPMRYRTVPSTHTRLTT